MAIDIDMSQFYQTFFEEAAEHLETLESLLLTLDPAAPDQEDLNAIFRAAHSIKGGAATFGFVELAEATHLLENLLDQIRKGKRALQPKTVDLFLEAKDVLRSVLSAYQKDEAIDKDACVLLQHALSAAASDKPIAAVSDKTTIEENTDYGFFDEPPPAQPSPILIPAETAYGLFEDEPAAPVNSASTTKQIVEAYGFFSPLAEKKVEKPQSTPETSIRVSVEKVDQLVNLVGELIIAQSMLLETVRSMQNDAPEALYAGLSQIERHSRDLQEAIMAVRMMPVSSVFQRFSRLVHSLSTQLGKSVQLLFSGEGTELDKNLIEKLVDPLTHLIRNSLDHGIESPEQREAVGKNRQGTITLSASHQGGNMIINVIDDGAGLSREKILSKAWSHGMTVDENASDKEVFQLIFDAGFSTATTVTDVSGRGVGMDVVRRNIESLGGRIEISSLAGMGMRTTIRLPLTLTILDGMVIAVGDQQYILPLNAVIESFQALAGDVRMIANQERLVKIRDDYLPLIVLHENFGLASRFGENQTAFLQGLMVVVEGDTSRAVFFVDELLGQQQIVVKNLEANYHYVAGFSGATIMGNGRVALILDVATLILRHLGQNESKN